MICQQCNGHAWNSVICMAYIDPVATYRFDEANMPPRVTEILKILGSDIQHHADIDVIPRPADIEKERDDIILNYHIKVPMADITFNVEDKLDIPAFMFGIQGQIYNTTGFLEKIMAPGLKALKLAAKGQGDTAAHLKKAGQYRTLKFLILATAKLGAKKAFAKGKKEIPHGLSEDGLKKIILEMN